MRLGCGLIAALVLAPAASAQNADKPLDEIFADLALGYCPLVLAGQFSLDGNPALTGMGFPAKPTPLRMQSGPIPSLSLTRADGSVSFAGAPGRVCRVAIEGGQGEAARSRLRDAMAGMAGMGTDFKPAPDIATPLAGATVEAFSAKVDGQVLNLQLYRLEAPKLALIAQLYVTEE